MDTYFIGNLRHGRKRKRRIRRRILWSLALLLLGFLLLCRFSLYPYLESKIESEAKRRLTAVCADSVFGALASGEYGYESFIRLGYTQDGRVSSAQINTPLLNHLRYQIAKEMLSRLKTGTITIRVPFSNLFGSVLFSGVRASLPVTLEAADSIIASFSSHFEEHGINQTRHLITFDFILEVSFLLPARSRTLSVTSSVAAIETLIVGEVPDSFTDIDRLTDDASEIIIDDAVDFGNVIY